MNVTETIRRQVHFGRGADRKTSLLDENRPAEEVHVPARVARVMALAIHLQRVTNSRLQNLAAVARSAGVSRARVTQIVNLNLLAPDIQESILGLSFGGGREPVTDRDLRPLVREPDWDCQRELWREFCRRAKVETGRT